MTTKVIHYEILFEIKDVFGKKIRTTTDYWHKIKTLKHQELRYSVVEVKKTISSPDEVRVSITDETILLFAKRFRKYDILIVAVKVLNGEGFIVTAYQTKKYKEKGQLIWPK